MAYVHWHRWGACPDNNPTAEFWNSSGAYENVSLPDGSSIAEDSGVWYTDSSPANGNHHYYWKVNASPGTNTFNATGCYETSGQHCDARWFVAVINNTDVAHRTHDGHWWHNTGYKKTESGAEQETWYYNASNNPINTAANYTLWTAQSHYDNSNPPIEFNGHQVGTVGSDCECHGDGEYADFSLCKFNVPSNYIDADGDQKVEWKYNNDAYYVNFGTLAEVIPQPDFVITDIEANEITLRANKNYKINATVKNIGSANVTDTFNLSLYVNGTYHNKTSVSGGLDIGESKEETFALPVNLPKGCHNFTVVADCDADIAESDETNNATTEFYQVGYVLVVEGNGGFDDLVTESENGAFGDGNVTKIGNTYYIRNFTGNYGIENCAGCGISIKDTTAAFVIQNCTVHNCGGKGSTGDSAGICLDNVTNGEIGKPGISNTIENNTNAGIRVKNSTYVDIADNTIRNNTKYGVYAYPRALPVTPETCDDCKYINVTNNTVTENEGEGVDLIAYNCTVENNTITDNTKYGMYLMGNYSNVTDNVIQNNTDYGVKLYNSSDNYIYENVFIDNNASNSGHQACDNKNSNHWNITDIGNYWSDLKDNTNFPDNYSIDCGTNIDYHPMKLYDFSTRTPGTDAWAFRYQNNSKPPTTCDVPSTEFTSTEYGYIKADDGTYQHDESESNSYAAHRFNISIDEDATNISMINVTWKGRGQNTLGDGATLYIYNFTATSYGSSLDSNNDANEVTLTGGVTNATDGISNYINAANVTVLVEQNTATSGFAVSKIDTDYVKVVITPGA